VIQDIKDEYKKGCNFKVVGSAKRNLVVVKGDSPWDIDFHIILNNKVFNNICACEIKFFIFNSFKDKLDDQKYSVNMSTSVIEINLLENYKSGLSSFDIAVTLIRTSINKLELARGKVEDKGSPDYVNWGLVEGSENSYYFRESEIKNRKTFKDIFLEKKCENFDKKEEDKKETIAIFIESIKETLDKERS